MEKLFVANNIIHHIYPTNEHQLNKRIKRSNQLIWQYQRKLNENSIEEIL